MDKVLLKWSSNWADEMDIEGISIMKSDEWKAYKKKLELKKSFSLYVGTNEEIEYESGEDLIAEIKVKKITPEEEKVIKKFIGSEFGHQDFIYVFDDTDDDESDDEDEDDEIIVDYSTGY